VLVAATDPITLTTQEIGRFSVSVNANDVAVMGVRPRWFLAVILLPLGTTEARVRERSSPACKTAFLVSAPLWSAATRR
jgi:hydrogenase maturation factor